MSGWERVYRAVRRIPAGRVASYGQIAGLSGMPRAARQVGYALHALAVDSPVPWHRVVDAAGRIRERSAASELARLQRARLEAEGVAFDVRGAIDLDRFGWRPRAPRSADAPRPRAGGRASRCASDETTSRRKSRGAQA